MDIHFMLVYAQDYTVIFFSTIIWEASLNKPQLWNDAFKLMIQ